MEKNCCIAVEILIVIQNSQYGEFTNQKVAYRNVPQPFFLPTAHTTLTMAHEGTSQNFALRRAYKTIRGHKKANPLCIRKLY
jgi:hypothetical protein